MSRWPTTESPHADEIFDLFEVYAQGELDEVGSERLSQILLSDEAARQQFVALVHIGALAEQFEGRESDEAAIEKLLEEASTAATGVEDPEAVDTSSLTPLRSPKSWLDRASRRPVPPALAIAALVMISVVAWMGVTEVKNQLVGGGGKSTDELQKTKKPKFVAWLMKAHKTQWLHGTQPQKTRLMPGQRLAISKGLIEIQYRTRAVVVIEGPAEFYVGGKRKSGNGKAESGKEDSSLGREPVDREKAANSGYLALGSLVARVEGKKAQGFTIDTPNARVKDFGTEFGVDVAVGGLTAVHVFDGKVRVDGPTGSSSRSVELATGESVRVGRNQIVANATGNFAADFVRVLPIGRNLTPNAAILVAENFASGSVSARKWISEARSISAEQEWVWSSPDDSVDVRMAETWIGEQGAALRGLSAEYDHDQNAHTPLQAIPGGLELMSSFADRDPNRADTVRVSVQVTLPETLDEQLEGKLTFFIAERAARNVADTAPRVSVHNVSKDREILALTPLASEKYPNTDLWQYRTIPIAFTSTDAGDTIEIRFQDSVSGGNASARGLHLADVRLLVAIRRSPAAKDNKAKAENEPASDIQTDTKHTAATKIPADTGTNNTNEG